MSAVGELTVNIVGDMSKLSSAFSQASSEVGKFGNSVTGIGSSMTSKVGSALTTVGKTALVTGTALGAGLTAGGVKATLMFQDFEKSVANAASVTGKTGEAFSQAKENISAVAQELGQATSFSSSQAADAMYDLASAGYDVSTMASNDLVPMLNLAAGTQYDLEETTDTMASTLSQFGLGFESAGRVADVFAASCGATQANMEKLSYSMKYVGTISDSAGMSIEETTASLGLLYNAGLNGESAGTGLRGVLASLISPTNNAAAVIKDMGLTLDDVNPTTSSFSEVIQKLADKGLNTSQAFQIFGREAAPAVLALTSQSGQLEELTTQLENAGGAAQTMADEQLDTLAGSLDGLSGSLENMMINIGQALAPTIRQVADALVPMIPSIQDYIIAIVNVFVSFVSQLGSSVSSIKAIGSTILDVFSSVFEAIAGAGSGVASSAANVINGIMQRIAGIVIETAPYIENAITGIIGYIKNLTTALQPTWASLTSVATNLITLFNELFSSVSGTSGNIANIINTVSSVLAQLVSAVTSAFIKILPTLQSIFSTIVDILHNVYTSMSTAINNISEKLGPTWTNLGLIFDAGSRLVTGAIQPLIPAFSSLFNSLNNSSTIDSISTTIANFFNTVTEAIAGFMMSLAENGGISDAIEDAFGIDLSTASDNIKTAFDTIKSVFDTGKTIITGFISDLAPSWDNLKSSFDSIKTIILEVAPSFASFFETLGGSSGNSAVTITSLLAGVINTLTGAVAGLLKWLADNPKVVEFGLALAGVAVAASGLVIGLAGVIAMLTPIFAAISSGIAFVAGLSLSWASLGTVIGVIGTSLFPTLAAAIGTVGSIALPVLSTAFGVLSTIIGIVAYTVIPILIEALGLLISPVGLIIGTMALLYVAWTKNWGDIQGKTGEAIDFIKVKWNQFASELGRLPGVASTALSTLVGVFRTAFNNIITDIQSWITRQQERYTYAIVQLNGFKAQAIQRWNEIKASVLIKLNETVSDIQNWSTRQREKFNTFIAQLTTFKTQVLAKWTEIKISVLAKFNEIVSDAQNWVSRQKEIFNNAVSAVNDLKTRFLSGFQDMLTGVKTKVTNIVDAVGEIPAKIKNKATEFYNAGVQVVQKLVDGLLSKLSSIKEAVSKITSAASLSGLSSSVSKSTSSLSSTLSSSIKSAGSSAKVSLSEAAQGLKRLLPNSPAKEGPFKTLPNWDAVFLDPLTESISKINTLSSPLSTALSNIRNPVDENISSGLNTISNVTTSNSYTYGGDTLSLGGVTLNNSIDINALFDEWERRMANKRRARGI